MVFKGRSTMSRRLLFLRLLRNITLVLNFIWGLKAQELREAENTSQILGSLRNKHIAISDELTALGRENSANLIPALRLAIRDKNLEIRLRTLEILWYLLPFMDSDAEMLIPDLINTLKDYDANARGWAADDLGQIGPYAKGAVPALISACKDPDTGVQSWAIKALGLIGPDAKSAIPTLLSFLRNTDSNLQNSAADALHDIGESSVPALLAALKDVNPSIRNIAASHLGRFEDSTGAIYPALAVALRDPDPAVRFSAYTTMVAADAGLINSHANALLTDALADARPSVRSQAAELLGKCAEYVQQENGSYRYTSQLAPPDPSADRSVTALKNLLKDSYLGVRIQAAKSLGHFRFAASPAVPMLVAGLRDSNESFRSYAAEALGYIGPMAKSSIPALVLALRDPDVYVRRYAAIALGSIGSSTEGVISELISALNDSDSYVRADAAESLGMLNPIAIQAVPALLQKLHDPDQYVRNRAGIALTIVGSDAKEAIPEFLAELKSKDPVLRARAGEALGRTGPNAKKSIPDFIVALKDTNPTVRAFAASDLGRMGAQATEAIPALTVSLKDPSPEVRTQAAASLGRIGPNARTATRSLLAAMKDSDSLVRANAALALCNINSNETAAMYPVLKIIKDPEDKYRYGYWAAQTLGKLGPSALKIIPELLTALKSPNEIVRSNIAYALVGISASARDNKQVQAIPLLKRAAATLRSTPYTSQLRLIQTDIALLEAIQPPWYGPLYNQVSEHPYVALLISIYPLLTLGCLIALWTSPFLLWRLNNTPILSRQVKPSWMGGIELSLADLMIFGFFRYNHRVLDAWVTRHLGTVRSRFTDLDIVKEREIRVNVPVTLNRLPVPELKPKDLWQAFNAPQTCLLIWGEGGLGKTSLVCQIARWVMAPEKDMRPTKYPMLPVIIEQDLDLPFSGDKNVLLEIVRGWLKYLTDQAEPPHPEFVRHLLKQKRVLLIVDGLSEMSEETRKKIRPIDPDFDANALVVTSRIEERLDTAVNAVVHPERIRGDRLATFMSTYLSYYGKQTFMDSELFDGCRQLATMLKGGEATVLLAKLFADLMIGRKENQINEALPQNIPDLMLKYLNRLNRQDPEKNHRIVQSTAKLIAWECLRQNFRPVPASFQAILIALGDGAEQRIRYLESKLRIIETVGSDHNHIRFVLDPLAEYMASLHVMEECRDNPRKWKQIFQQLDATSYDRNSTRGFVAAMRDCYLVRKEEFNVPSFVDDELVKRISSQPEPYPKLVQTKTASVLS